MKRWLIEKTEDVANNTVLAAETAEQALELHAREYGYASHAAWLKATWTRPGSVHVQELESDEDEAEELRAMLAEDDEEADLGDAGTLPLPEGDATETGLEAALVELLAENDAAEILAELAMGKRVHVRTFADAGITGSHGLLLYIGGEEFQIAITRTPCAGR